jgi:hypothetical protein
MSEENQRGNNLSTNSSKWYGISKTFLKYLAAFIVGAVVSFVVTYLIVFQSFLNGGTSNVTPNSTQTIPSRQISQAPKVEQSPTAKSQVSEKEVQAYAETIDCSTLDKYSKLTIDTNRVLLKSIDLERAQINIQFFETPAIRSMNYLSIPEVVDHKCNTIKLSDLKAGQTIRLYDYNAAAAKDEPEKRSYIFLVQKISR